MESDGKGTKSLVELYTKCNFYIKNKNYPEAVALFNREKQSILAIPGKLKVKTISLHEALRAIHLLSILISPYTELADTAGVQQVVDAALGIHQALVPLIENDDRKTIISNPLIASLRYFQYIFLKDYPAAHKVLNKTAIILANTSSIPEDFRVAMEYNLMEWWILYYLETKTMPMQHCTWRNIKVPFLFRVTTIA